jgi:hypothetical protein
MKHTSVIAFFITSVSLISCDVASDRAKQHSTFREVENYFVQELTVLEKSNAGLTKTLFNNRTKEQSVRTNPDWKAELAPFTEAISNQPAPANSFKTDTVMFDHSRMVLFTARDPSATIEKLFYYSNDEKTDSIVIIKKVSNSYYSATDTLSYYGNGNYRISAENHPRIGKKITFVLEGQSSLGTEK